MQSGDTWSIEEIITLPRQSKSEIKKETEMFKENFSLILDNSRLIMNTPRYYYSYLESFIVGLVYLGGHKASIGSLLQLWEKGIFMDECRHCGGSLYLFSGKGSPLSGSNSCAGICNECREISHKNLPDVKQIMNAYKHVKDSINARLILRTKGQTFSFKSGLVGSPVPDRIIRQGISPATMTELINEIRMLER
ncbi:hypothetical protein [Desulfonatronovibrio magnus]|uniref:hypothetical protein n=1 Tax=Desulfonatronovibrio magnus TaxID=698827 RepID=UPI0005EB1E5C|nr:hypothetical protein [Desulfonatronovibrio magnus]